jgi:hypothetical protein
MNVKAVKITEAQRYELASNVAVTGSGPGAAASATPAAPAAPAASTAAPAAPASAGAAPAKTLPKTATQLPLLGLTGIASLLTGLSLTVRRLRAGR